jgi:hypothetical protein
MMLDVMRRLVKHRVPELVVTGVARHPECPHSARSLAGAPRQGCPLNLRHAGSQ